MVVCYVLVEQKDADQLSAINTMTKSKVVLTQSFIALPYCHLDNIISAPLKIKGEI